MAVAVDDDRRLDDRQVLRLVAPDVLDDDAEAVRDLLARPLEELLADDLGDARLRVGRRDRLGREEVVALGEVRRGAARGARRAPRP